MKLSKTEPRALRPFAFGCRLSCGGLRSCFSPALPHSRVVVRGGVRPHSGTERQRKWTLFALMWFWIAAPQSDTVVDPRLARSARRFALFPPVDATPDAGLFLARSRIER